MLDRPKDSPLPHSPSGRAEAPDRVGAPSARPGTTDPAAQFSNPPASRSAPTSTSRVRKLAFGALALVAVAFAVKAGAHWLFTGRFQVETDDAYVEADTSILAPETTGHVTEVLVAENAQVKAGDILVRLSDADARARLAQAEGAAANARAALANVEARQKLQGSMIRSAEATVVSAQSDVTRTVADHQRYTALMNSRITTPQRYETARSEAEKARAALTRANAGVEAERQQLVVLQTQIDQSRAQISLSEAQVELARIEVARTVIRAPISGVVGNRGVQVGQYVRPGIQLMAIVPIPVVRVVANFKETQISGLKRGQPVDIHSDAWPDVHIAGTVESLSPASGSRFSLLPPDNATGNFTKIVQRVPVRIAIDPANALAGRLRPGLSVIVTIDRRAKGDGEQADLLVPMPPKTSPQSR